MSSSPYSPVTIQVPQFMGREAIVVVVNPATGEVVITGAVSVRMSIPIRAGESVTPIFSGLDTRNLLETLVIDIRPAQAANVMDIAFHTQSSLKGLKEGKNDPVVSSVTSSNGDQLSLAYREGFEETWSFGVIGTLPLRGG